MSRISQERRSVPGVFRAHGFDVMNASGTTIKTKVPRTLDNNIQGRTTPRILTSVEIMRSFYSYIQRKCMIRNN
jgi:hypothetical protein